MTATGRRGAAAAPRAVRMQVDGASRGNPGPAGAGVAFFDAAGRLIGEAGKYLGTATNNEAEYQGLLLGLDIAAAHGLRDLDVAADSELLVKQLNGQYKVRHPRLQPLHAAVCEKAARLGRVTFRHVYREENTEADRMSNEAIDRRLRGIEDLVWHESRRSR